jgi:hypothetical protein
VLIFLQRFLAWSRVLGVDISQDTTMAAQQHQPRPRTLAMSAFFVSICLACMVVGAQSFQLTDVASSARHAIVGRGTSAAQHCSPVLTLRSSREEEFDDRRKSYPLNDAIDEASSPTRKGGKNMPEKESLRMIPSFVESFWKKDGLKKLPPLLIEDMNVLLYDIFLLVNLSLSISFWVTHRLSVEFLISAFSEGCLLSILWIGAGLYHGAFLMSAVDGHYGSADERGGPKAAAMLGLSTFVHTINLRVILALVVAIAQHRPVGVDPGEQMLPLEIPCGLVLMSTWRAVHSIYTPRI